MEENNANTEIAKGERGMMRGPVAENSEEGMQRPEMPEMECEEETGCEPPEMLEEMEGGMMGGEMMKGGRGEFLGQEANTNSESVLHPVAYLALGGGSVILSTLIAYAAFSKFFTKRPGETFKTAGRFWGFVATLLVLAIGLITLCYFIPIWVS